MFILSWNKDHSLFRIDERDVLLARNLQKFPHSDGYVPLAEVSSKDEAISIIEHMTRISGLKINPETGKFEGEG